MAAEVAETKAVLDQVVIVDLPELEEAIREGDYDLAFARAAIVRDIRNRVRSLLAGADGSGALRTEWAKVEPRIDVALMAAPRPNADPVTGRQAWQTQRTARGTDAHTRRPRLSSGASLANRRAQRPSAALRAVGDAVRREVYYAPDRAAPRGTAERAPPERAPPERPPERRPERRPPEPRPPERPASADADSDALTVKRRTLPRFGDR
jgi:hypothetical protein